MARVRMDRWYRRMSTMLEMELMRVHLMVKFVDDVNIVLQSLGLGARWADGEVKWKLAWEEEDRAAGRTEDRVTMDVFLAMANSLEPDLTFTIDICDNHQDRKVPMLDFAVWRRRRWRVWRLSGTPSMRSRSPPRS